MYVGAHVREPMRECHQKQQYICTVKPVENGHSKIVKIKILMTDGSLIKVESIVECSKVIILQYVDLH